MASGVCSQQNPGKFYSRECCNYTQLFLCSRRSFSVHTSLCDYCNDCLSPDICVFHVAITISEVQSLATMCGGGGRAPLNIKNNKFHYYYYYYQQQQQQNTTNYRRLMIMNL